MKRIALALLLSSLPISAAMADLSCKDRGQIGRSQRCPCAIARECCRRVLIKPHANPEFTAQGIGIMEVLAPRCDRLPHAARVCAQKPVISA